MYAWIDLYMRKQNTTNEPIVFNKQKCPFERMVRQRLSRVEHVLDFFHSICKKD
jgi:hypothetical protein